MLPEEPYSPGTPVNPPNASISSQSSVRPESETFPEPIITSNATTPAVTPPQSVTNNQSPDNFPNVEHDNAIDLDTPNDESLDADDGENVLSCHEISNFLQEEPLQEWNVFHPGSETFEVCLAEDGMPLIDEPMSHHEH